MDIDADDHSKERIPLFGMDAHVVKMVVVKSPVIDPFAGSPVVVNLLIFLSASGHRGIEPDVPVWLCVDTASIGRRGTFLLAGAGVGFPAGKGAAPFAGMLLFTIAPVDHAQACHAQGSAVTVNGNGIGDGRRPAAVFIEVDEGPDLPLPAEPIGGIVVMGGVQADIPDGDIRVPGCEFAQGDDGADAVISPSIKEADMQGKVHAGLCIMGAEHVEGVPKIKGIEVAVPAPVRIRVGEMAFTGTVGNAMFRTFADLVPVRGGMGMDTGAVAGKGDAVLWDKPVPQGREERGKAEELLEPFFIMEREVFMCQ